MTDSADRTGYRHLPPGTAVEVHNGFTGGWTPGFEVEQAGPDGYRLRRVSDASVLPCVFTTEAIRTIR